MFTDVLENRVAYTSAVQKKIVFRQPELYFDYDTSMLMGSLSQHGSSPGWDAGDGFQTWTATAD
jgi:hypothetical protein